MEESDGISYRRQPRIDHMECKNVKEQSYRRPVRKNHHHHGKKKKSQGVTDWKTFKEQIRWSEKKKILKFAAEDRQKTYSVEWKKVTELATEDF